MPSGSMTTSGAGARRGAQVLARLRESPPAIWYGGQPVADVTTHPATKNGVHSLAGLYDLQWNHADVMLYDSPSTGQRVGRTFMMPRTQDELRGVSRAMKVWADATFGMMGRSPDYLNRAITGYAAGAAFLAEGGAHYGENARLY